VQGKINYPLLVGFVFIIFALGVWFISIIELVGNQYVVNDQNSRIEEVWEAKGTLEWWKIFYNSTTIPVTSTLGLIGVVSICFGYLRRKSPNYTLLDFMNIEILQSEEEQTVK
jgi:uncharacterized membrane protein